MPRLLRLMAALLLVGGARAVSAEDGGSPDPAFKSIPFARWIEEGDQAHIRWNAHVLPVELSAHQRLQAKVEIQLDGAELVRRKGKGYMVMLVQFSDSENRVYQTHQLIDLQLVKDDAGKTNISYLQTAFVTPGDYRVSLAVFDTTTQEHSAIEIPLHVHPLKADPLPDAWRDLPPIEIPKSGDSPDNLFLPGVMSRLHLPLESRHPVRLELVVNASPLAASEPSPREQANNRTLASLIPAMKVITNTEVRNGSLNVAVLDLSTQQVIFEQAGVRDLDWPKLRPALKQTGSNLIDVHALENRRQNAQFFVSQVRRRIGVDAANDPSEPAPVLIVLSGPMEFSSGEDLQPIRLEGKPSIQVFYIRYHSLLPPAASDPYGEQTRRGRRMMPLPSRQPAALIEPFDSLERTLKPLQPRLFDVYTPDQFRDALATLLREISKS